MRGVVGISGLGMGVGFRSAGRELSKQGLPGPYSFTSHLRKVLLLCGV